MYCPRCQKNGRLVRSTKQLIVSVLEVALSFTGAQFVVPQSDSDQCSGFYFQLQECACINMAGVCFLCSLVPACIPADFFLVSPL